MSKDKIYNLVIVGAGPAALTAAIYAARYNLDFLIIGQTIGGNMSLSFDIDNYPGFVHTTGQELSQKMQKQVEALGHEIIIDNISNIEEKDGFFELKGRNKNYKGKNILLAIGTEKNKLNIPGEKEFTGKGVSYCATCDGFFFKDKTVAVVGGGDAAAEAAYYLSDIAKKVYIILRRNVFRAEPSWQKRIKNKKNIEIIYEANVKEIIGKEKVEKIRLDKNNAEMEVDGVFIEIGETPSSIIFNSLGLKRDDDGYVVVDEEMKTPKEGVWAAGDSTTGSNKFRQIITACAEGAIAVNSIFKKISKN